MDLKRILGAGLVAAMLAGCTPTGDPGDADAAPETEDTLTAEEAEMNEVFEANIPWDSTRQNVEITETGLQYVVLSKGGEQGLSPVARDTVEVHYEGRLARNGETFDSSFKRGATATFPLNGVIKGWTEGLQYMSEGDDFMFYIPADLAYGNRPRPGGAIQPGDDLVFRVQLIKVTPAPPPKAVDEDAWAAYTPWDSSREGVQKTGSGLEYVVLHAVEEGPSPKPDDRVVVFYEGRLDSNGEMFDSAYERGEPALFPAGGLIPGWVEALALMKRGERYLIHVPSELAYGEAGTPDGVIPPSADLNFEIELMDVLQVQ